MAGIYLHVPFCRVRCPYCDFNTYAGVQDRIPAYVDALVQDLRRQLLARPQPLPVATVYFGGGTPSLLPPEAVARLLEVIRECAAPQDLEVTLESNPGTVDRERIAAFLSAGVTRLTLGAQTFNPRHLARLGRLHTVEETRAAIDAARSAGVSNLNLDLMFALPDQTLDEWREDLRECMAHAPEHLSLYNLTIEPRTPFAREQAQGRLVQPEEEHQRAMHELAWEATAAAGLERYEVSNFARPGKRCAHNRTYWQGDPWLAIGAGAHGFEPDLGPYGRRAWVVPGIGEYVARVRRGDSTEAGHELLGLEESATEALMLGLRVAEGLDRRAFAERHGFDLVDAAAAPLATAAASGLLSVSTERIVASEAGEIILDFVVSELASALDTFLQSGNDGRSSAEENASARAGATTAPAGGVAEGS